MLNFEITETSESYYRCGKIITEHGIIKTPTYMPVGTFGPVKSLDVSELSEIKSQIVLGNSFHLHSNLGAEFIKKMGGLAKFTCWNGPTLTDSGGYQVSYMWKSGTHSLATDGKRQYSQDSPIKKITDDGVKIKDIHTGDYYWLTPKKSMEIQAQIGADMVMAFDQPTFDTDNYIDAEKTLNRSHIWTKESFLFWEELQKIGDAQPWQSFIPIIQGGRFYDLRQRSAQYILEMETTGIAIAGESIGIDPDISAETIDSVREIIPSKNVLYAMGLGGGPEGFLKAVKYGMDIFDNTSPTRLARCGYTLISPDSGGSTKNKFRIPLFRQKYREDKNPIDIFCNCHVCSTYSRAYLNYLLKIKDILGIRLLSYHNVYFMNDLSYKIQYSIANKNFEHFFNHWIN